MKPIDHRPAEARQTYRIPISTVVIQSFLDTLARAGTAYGVSDEQIIAEDSLNGHDLQVSLRQDSKSWTVIVRSAPPLDAIISLHIGQYIQHQGFSSNGETLFTEVPEASLRGGFDLVLTLPGPTVV